MEIFSFSRRLAGDAMVLVQCKTGHDNAHYTHYLETLTKDEGKGDDDVTTKGR